MIKNKDDFFNALNALPLINDVIQEYCQKIIKLDTTAKNEKKLIEEDVNNIMIEYNDSNNHNTEDGEVKIKLLLQIMFEKQLGLTRQGEKLRKLKGNPPSAFR